MTIAIVLLVLFLMDFSPYAYIEFRDKLSYNLLIWYMGILSVIAWICVGIYCKHMIKLKSTSLFNLVLLTIISNISITAAVVAPQIMYYLKVSSEKLAAVNFVIVCVTSSIGILEFIVLILNKKTIRLIRRIMNRYRHKQSVFQSTSGVLIEINERRQSLSDGGLLCYFFDQVTKEVLYR